MGRIRTIKSEFGRDEKLQDLERANPGQHCMLVFVCLWAHCDKNGAFPWNPRMLHLDILPFLDFDLSRSLVLLREALVLDQYVSDDGKEYGRVRNFAKHQRIHGKEAIEPAKYPVGKQSRSSGDQLVGQELEVELGNGKGRGKGKGGGGEQIPMPPSKTTYLDRIADDHQTFHPLQHAAKLLDRSCS